MRTAKRFLFPGSESVDRVRNTFAEWPTDVSEGVCSCVYHVLLEGCHVLLDDLPSIHRHANTQTSVGHSAILVRNFFAFRLRALCRASLSNRKSGIKRRKEAAKTVTAARCPLHRSPTKDGP